MAKTILIVAAHPDDEILGCAGTVSRLIKEGYQAYTLILGEGKTARDEKRVVTKREQEIKELHKEIKKSNKILGIKEVFLHDFPDNRFDSIALLDIVKVIEKVKQRVKPDTVFTHYEKDLNIDHQVTNQAVITATRPVKGESVQEIYAFEVLSSTEWNFPLNFSPNVFFNISKTLSLKIKSMEIYQSELNKYPHPRSLEGIRLSAENWGMKVGVKYAEAFQLIRSVR